MKTLMHPHIRPLADLLDGLSAVARESARQLARSHHEATRRRVGSALRPGTATPLWNALVAEVQPLLRRRGDKVLLARILGLPRQRVHDFLVGRHRLPDAERALLLMEWLLARKRGQHPG